MSFGLQKKTLCLFICVTFRIRENEKKKTGLVHRPLYIPTQCFSGPFTGLTSSVGGSIPQNRNRFRDSVWSYLGSQPERNPWTSLENGLLLVFFLEDIEKTIQNQRRIVGVFVVFFTNGSESWDNCAAVCCQKGERDTNCLAAKQLLKFSIRVEVLKVLFYGVILYFYV